MRLSVILAATEPWPDLKPCLDVLLPQVEALDGELLVADGHGHALDQAVAAAHTPRLRWLRLPGASVFDLRAAAIQATRGVVIATTEDHCVPGPDWCARLMDSLAAHPEADAVFGPVLNGSVDSQIDIANHLHTFGPFLPPCNTKQRLRCPANANIAYRREVVPAGPIAAGWMEVVLNPALFHGNRFHVCDEMVVTHVQSFGFLGTLRSHFDNGRATASMHPMKLSRRQVPGVLFREFLWSLGGGPAARRKYRASLAFVFLISCAHAFGETMGILAGPGRSANRLR